LSDFEQIASALDRNFERQTAWLSHLVQFRSTRGHEQACQNWLYADFLQRGWSVDRFSLADVDLKRFPAHAPMDGIDESKSIQLIASLPHSGGASGKSLILQGHVDVVPEGPSDMWQRPAYSGEVADGWLYGRGAQDMKMGIAAIVFALDAIAQAGLEPAAPVFVQTVTEEESTGNGALAVLARGCRADACLIPEPTANTITRAQTGAIWFRLKVKGKPVHVGRAETGSNAILSMFSLIAALQQMTAHLNTQAKTDKWFASLVNPIKFNVGVIHGGDWASSTPSWCEADCRLGALPGADLQDLKRQIVQAVAEAAQHDSYLKASPPDIVWNGFQADGAVLESGSDAEAALRTAHKQIFGTDMEERLATAVNDTRYYSLYYGIPALCYGPAGKGMHGVDERANLANLKQTTLVLAQFIANWCLLRRKKS
jgi:acetylornithine deacetylase